MGAGTAGVAVDRVVGMVPVEDDLARLAIGPDEAIAADDRGGMLQPLDDVLFQGVVEHDRRQGGRLL